METEDTMKVLNSEENKDGKKIKFVLITSAASEGIDYKNIR